MAPTSTVPSNAVTNRRSSTSTIPVHLNQLTDLESSPPPDDEEPPPYSRYDPLTHPHPNGSDENLVNNGNFHQQIPVPVTRPQLYPTAPQNRHSRSSRPRSTSSTYPGRVNRQSPTTGNYPSQYPPQRQTNSPFNYPPGYLCPKCYNTGFKTYNGSPCGTCARLFGKQNADVFPSLFPH